MKNIFLLLLFTITISPINCNLVTPPDILNLNKHLIDTHDCLHSFLFIIDMFNGTGLYLEYQDVSILLNLAFIDNLGFIDFLLLNDFLFSKITRFL